MAKLNMKGPYKLTRERIDEVVTERSPGNYALGLVFESRWHLRYVGRSDDDVNMRLKAWVGRSPKYAHFKFSYATSPKAAFEKECNNWHEKREIVYTIRNIPNALMVQPGSVLDATYMTETRSI